MSFRVGDVVTIKGNDLTWEIIGMPVLQQDWATLKSGLTGRTRHEPVENLRLHPGRRLVE